MTKMNDDERFYDLTVRLEHPDYQAGTTQVGNGSHLVMEVNNAPEYEAILRGELCQELRSGGEVFVAPAMPKVVLDLRRVTEGSDVWLTPEEASAIGVALIRAAATVHTLIEHPAP